MPQKKRIFLATSLFVVSAFSFQACSQGIQLGNIGKLVQSLPISSTEASSALKQALEIGVNKSTQLASATGGYSANPLIRIPVPPELQNVEKTLRSIGLGNQVDQFVLAMNQGAEKAAKEAAPIFLKSITEMTVTDAISIVKGEKNAATTYLNRTSRADLSKLFQPIMAKSLQETTASKLYGDIVTRYNQVPFVKKLNPNLEQYATEKALDGLFVLIAQEEAKIRENPLERTTELLKKVFANTTKP